jgi:hypothetical protein
MAKKRPNTGLTVTPTQDKLIGKIQSRKNANQVPRVEGKFFLLRGVPPKLHHRFKLACTMNGTSMTLQMLKLMRQYVESELSDK